MQSFENRNYNFEYYMNENVCENKCWQLKLKLKNITAIRECVINHQKAIELVYFYCIYISKYKFFAKRKTKIHNEPKSS